MTLQGVTLGANVFVVADIGKSSQDILWTATIAGGRVCTLEYFLTGGGSGPALVFKPSIGTERLVWMSDSFVQEEICPKEKLCKFCA